MSRILWVVFILALVVSSYAADHRCATREALHAEAEADTLRSWNTLYKSYRSYRQCDDGSIGEGYSESVARIIVDHWETLPRFAQLARNDPDFRRFVLKHVDETLDMKDVEKIRMNAKSRCPNRLRVLCDD